MNAAKKKAWNPYVVGALIGGLSWFAYATAGKLLGITTPFENTAALAGKTVAPAAAAQHSYFKSPDASPEINWEWMLVLGVFIGAWMSSKISGDRNHEKVHALWRARFGDSVAGRYAGAFVGGGLMMFGARLAKGCTSGHGISGILQFAASSYIFVATFGVVGVLSAYMIFGTKARDEVFGSLKRLDEREAAHG